MSMASYTSLFKAINFFFSRLLHKHIKTPRYLHRQVSNSLNYNNVSHSKQQTLVGSFDEVSINEDQSLVFNVEETLLKSCGLFPYFMLVAFEGGSPLRALILLSLYPLICLLGKEMGLKLMVFVCFSGIKEHGFVACKAVLHKILLEDVGLEGFEVVKNCRRKVGVSNLPLVMVESFLRDYLEIDCIVAKKLKVFKGRYIGLMEDTTKYDVDYVQELLTDDQMMSPNVVGISGSRRTISHPLFSICKEIYCTSDSIKKNWGNLPKESYPKPLIFHDGRLSFKPTPMATLTLFIYLPYAIVLSILRVVIALSLPQSVATPLAAFTGIRLLTTTPKSNIKSPTSKGQLYVCNHKTLLDPLFLSFALSKPLTAVTYSLSRMSEMLAPIKTVRLSRDRGQDGVMMKNLLSQGDLVVCPEGTTCREPFLLRFSPLFTEMSEQIVPLAMDCHVTMFYGTSASGLKCLDPIFFLMNPRPSYTLRLLTPVHGLSMSTHPTQSRFDVANQVQRNIGNALKFQCTTLTRKDKYLILAGNHGFV